MRRRAPLIVVALSVIGLGGCAALSPDPVTNTVTSTVTSTVTAVSTALRTLVETVTTTFTEPTTVTATPVADIPGPDGGPDCPADPSYFDESPDGLDADAVDAWHDAVDAAAAEHVTLCLNDGKRSRAQQQQIYDDYLRQYGQQTADELVLPPDKSSHVTGFAIDVQPADGYRWLEDTAGAYGWCRTYDNEPWHFEYRADGADRGCPDRLPAPAR